MVTIVGNPTCNCLKVSLVLDTILLTGMFQILIQYIRLGCNYHVLVHVNLLQGMFLTKSCEI